jgi:hypothetical protein
MRYKVNLASIGQEMKRQLADNRARKARAYNKRQAESYLTYCRRTGDATMIAYAETLLRRTA